ncbi:hypothetical protein LUZ60_006128 [Juncus effusus]|nr:hypothetical protein LUZ60_006128 [Juncus effusus]
MASVSLFSFFLISLFIPRYTAMAMEASPSSSTSTNSTAYIRTCCARTLYARLCYATLSPYSPRVQVNNPAQLARFAMNATLARLAPISARIAVLRSRAAADSASYPDHRQANALKDCKGSISSATDLIRNSEKEMNGLEEMVGPEVTWRIGNAQTWLSAAMTEEETCTDGFEGGRSGGDAGVEVCRKVKKVKQLTSNALALVNGLVNY